MGAEPAGMSSLHPVPSPRPRPSAPSASASGTGNPFALISQGGGGPYRNHCCPGEWTTIALVKGALRALTGAMPYGVPEQDLRISRARPPAIPKGHFVIRNVRRTSEGAVPSFHLTEARQRWSCPSACWIS